MPKYGRKISDPCIDFSDFRKKNTKCLQNIQVAKISNTTLELESNLKDLYKAIL